jgi:hypothetical protein
MSQTVAYRQLCGTVAYRQLCGTVAYRQVCGTVAYRQLCGTVAYRQLCGTVAYRQLCGTVDLQERFVRYPIGGSSDADSAAAGVELEFLPMGWPAGQTLQAKASMGLSR